MIVEPIENLLDEYPMLTDIISITVVLVVSIVAYLISKKYAPRAFQGLTRKTKTEIDDIIIKKVILKRLIYIIPLIIVNYFSYVFLSAEETIARITGVLMSVVILLTIGALIDAFGDIYERMKMSKKIPIKSHLQIVTIFIYVVGAVTILGQLTGRSPWYFITGVGMFTAIILMIFKNTILSFVASLQIASSDLFKEGDWLEIPKYGADGDVIDISLHTVSIQNWDKTITVIPTYKFMEESFKNWRGMSRSGGRRIKRSIHVDVSSIKFCDQEMLDHYKKFEYLTDYIERKEKEIEEYNLKHNVDDKDSINRRRLTNIGTFRAYMNLYLKKHPRIHHGLTFLIRQLPPGPDGLPIQVYVFTNTTDWVDYEGIQSDIFDHLLAVAPEFGLRVFQNPTGKDFGRLREVAG